jgi:hypothetical protein
VLLRYDGPDGITYDRVVTTVDGDGLPVGWAPYTLDHGDVIDGVALNPDERVFKPVTGKDAKTAVPRPADNDQPPAADNDDVVAPEPGPAVTPPAPTDPTPDAAPAANTQE